MIGGHCLNESVGSRAWQGNVDTSVYLWHIRCQCATCPDTIRIALDAQLELVNHSSWCKRALWTAILVRLDPCLSMDRLLIKHAIVHVDRTPLPFTPRLACASG